MLNGMNFEGTADFINSGVIRNTNNNLGWEDNFMTLFTTTFKAPTTGNYRFKMDRKDDRHAMWIDLDQDYLVSSKVVLEQMEHPVMKFLIRMVELLLMLMRIGHLEPGR